MRVLLAAPPFAGHLHPVLELAVGLRRRGHDVVVTTGAGRADLVRGVGLDVEPLFPDDPEAFERVANPGVRVGSHPVRLTRQLRANLALLPRARAELDAITERVRPDVVVADFTAPVAGYAALDRGIPWVTVCPSPCAIETRTGTPSYLGGWRPPRTALGRARDAVGRRAVRLGKLGMQRALARDFEQAGARVYREDGSEYAYSPHAILGLGMSEVELPRDWPAAFRMVGPLTASPVRVPPVELPSLPPGRSRVLVTLGTHLDWAKRDLLARVRALRDRVAGLDVVVGLGDAAGGRGLTVVEPGLAVVGYVDYDDVLPRCDAVVHHGGTGIAYAAIRAGVPALVVPHDFDQPDNAVRLAVAGAGALTRAPLGSARAARRLREVLAMDRTRLAGLTRALAGYDPVGATERVLLDLARSRPAPR
ncbi:glycosyltransferase [Salana multivorans]|uniref:glycosyltransferase n=1 Tax=Salana multivorans TaxID=120377 RepID=UPI001473A1BE|nr:glycosyltransferase [Salana multivorans]MBN8880727.1 glycosyltransferase family 1 protein [Salana multivorans]